MLYINGQLLLFVLLLQDKKRSSCGHAHEHLELSDTKVCMTVYKLCWIIKFILKMISFFHTFNDFALPVY